MKLLTFRQFVENLAGGSMVSTHWSNSDTSATKMFSGHPIELDGIDFVMGSDGIHIPTVVKKGKVIKFEEKKDPMEITLEDGSKIFLFPKDYENIQGQLPVIPNLTHLTVVYLRHPKDKSSNASKIHRCYSKFIGNSGQAKQYNITYNSNAMMLQNTF